MAALESASVDEKAKRVRDLLSSYYGTTDRSEAAAGGDSSSAPGSSSRASIPRPTGLDSAAFDAERYLSQLLRASRLDALLNRHMEMSAEIKSLDSDMQMLVYENYNKFISATDTIRCMKTNVDGMDSNMQELRSIIDKVADKNSAVKSKLQLRRDHIEELNQVRGLLFRLQAVFNLPQRLRAALDAGAVSIAVDMYADALPLLKKYGHKGTFRKVTAECQACAAELTALLKQRMVSQKDEAAECIQMVRKLGEPIESLQEDFLLCMRNRMDAVLAEAQLVAAAMAADYGLSEPAGEAARLKSSESWGFENGLPPPLKRFAVELDQRFLTELAHTAVLFGELFDPSGRKRMVKVTREAFAQYLKVVKRALSDAAAAESSRAAGCPMDGNALPASAPRADGADAAEDGTLPGGTATFDREWGAANLTEALYTISNDITRIQSLLPELQPQDRATEVVEGAVRHHVGACFSALEGRVLAGVHAAWRALEAAASRAASGGQQGSAQAPVLIQAFTGISEMVMAGTDALMHGMKQYQKRAWVLRSWQDVFVDLVQGQLQNLFLSLLAAFGALSGVRQEGLDPVGAAKGSTGNLHQGVGIPVPNPLYPATPQPKAGPPSAAAAAPSPFTPAREAAGAPGGPVAGDEPPPPALVLLLAKLCGFLETQAVMHVMEMIAVMFPGQGGGSGSDQPPAFVAGEVGRRLGTAANALVAGYVEAHGRRITLAVRRSVDAANWLAAKEPRGPRPVCDLLLDHLAAAEAEVAALADDAGRGGPAGGSGHGLDHAVERSRASTASLDSYGGGGGGATVSASVARLFRERAATAELEFSRPAILAALVRGALKSLVEALRLHTLGRAGLQQIQIDCAYLRPLLRRYVAGAEGGAVAHLLDEVVAAAAERALEPALLEPALLDRILRAAPARTPSS